MPGRAAWMAVSLLCAACAGSVGSPTPAGAGEARDESVPRRSSDGAPSPSLAPDSAVGPLQMRPTGLGYAEIVTGTGAEAAAGARVSVHFIGRLEDERVFDSTYERGAPFEFELGDGRVLQGFNEGVQGMRVGGKRRLIVPAPLGYGAQGAPPDIPPNALLEFDVELIAVEQP